MKYLALLSSALLMLFVLMLCAGEKKAEPTKTGKKKEEPTLEWNLTYSVREIPEGAKESLKDAGDYSKHQKDFKVKATISIYRVNNSSDAMAKAYSESGIIYFALVRDAKLPHEGTIRLYGAFQQQESDKSRTSTQWLFDPSKDIRDDKEIIISSSGGAREYPDKPGQLFKGRVGVWILIVKKADGDIAKLARESVITQRNRSIPAEEFGLPQELSQPIKKKNKEE